VPDARFHSLQQRRHLPERKLLCIQSGDGDYPENGDHGWILREVTVAISQVDAQIGAIRILGAVQTFEEWHERRSSAALRLGQGDIWAEAVRLRNTVRAEILNNCAEPDLAGERPELFSVEKDSA